MRVQVRLRFFDGEKSVLPLTLINQISPFELLQGQIENVRRAEACLGDAPFPPSISNCSARISRSASVELKPSAVSPAVLSPPS